MNEKGGRKIKDGEVVDGFNRNKVGGLRRKELAEAKRVAKLEAMRMAVEVVEAKKEFKKLNGRVKLVGKKLGIGEEKDKIEAVPEREPEEVPDDENEKSAMRMLQDLRYSYRNAKGEDGKRGRNRLVKLMESDSEFKFAMKELLKIESALLSAKIRAKDGGDNGNKNQMVFVVLKGLEEEKKFLVDEDKTVDMRQIQHVIEPENQPYEAARVEVEPEIEKPENW